MNLDLDSDYIHYAKTPHNTRCEYTLTSRFESVLPLLRNWGSVVTQEITGKKPWSLRRRPSLTCEVALLLSCGGNYHHNTKMPMYVGLEHTHKLMCQ
jgi:hypothetical protein